MLNKKFENKTVVVTGASSGIGFGIAKRFLDEGAFVVVVARNADKLTETFKEFPSEKISIVAGDVNDEATAKKVLAAAIELNGGLDILINGVGNTIVGSVLDLSVEDFDLILKTNVTSAFMFSKTLIPELEKTKGSIVNISSIQSFDGEYNSVAYNSSKAALNNLTRTMALDHAKSGIRINAVAPGFIETPRTSHVSDKLRQAYIDSTPLGRTGLPEDVANAISFLVSDEASFITGVILTVDGGRTIGGHAPKI